MSYPLAYIRYSDQDDCQGCQRGPSLNVTESLSASVVLPPLPRLPFASTNAGMHYQLRWLAISWRLRLPTCS